VTLRWRIALLVSAAIAVSYLDRQALPVAIQAIAREIPVSNEQFSQLQSAFLLAYAVMYAGTPLRQRTINPVSSMPLLPRPTS